MHWNPSWLTLPLKLKASLVCSSHISWHQFSLCGFLPWLEETEWGVDWPEFITFSWTGDPTLLTPSCIARGARGITQVSRVAGARCISVLVLHNSGNQWRDVLLLTTRLLLLHPKHQCASSFVVLWNVAIIPQVTIMEERVGEQTKTLMKGL